jgi:hypothetical protein
MPDADSGGKGYVTEHRLTCHHGRGPRILSRRERCPLKRCAGRAILLYKFLAASPEAAQRSIGKLRSIREADQPKSSEGIWMRLEVYVFLQF